MNAPNGYFLEHLLWHILPRDSEAVLAKGFRLELSDLGSAGIDTLNRFAEVFGKVWQEIPSDYEAQVCWSTDNDYGEALRRYEQETEREVATAWGRYSRQARVHRQRDLMESGRLRRERVYLYLSHRVSTELHRLARTTRGVLEATATLINSETLAFQSLADSLNTLLGDFGRLHPCADQEHYLHLHRLLNPSQRGIADEKLLAMLDLDKTFQSNCWFSDGLPARDAAFHLDDHYHALFVVRGWPRMSSPGQVLRLTRLPFHEYAITANFSAVDVRAEIGREEKLLMRLEGDAASEGKRSLLAAAQKRAERIDEMSSGQVTPFRVLYQVRAWDTTREGLLAKVNALKSAFADIGWQTHAVTHPITARELFFQSWPGATYSNYRGWHIEATQLLLACNLPLSSTFTGHLDSAEALYDGAHHNLVGVRTFVGPQPQHALLFGGSGAGKSAFLCDFLSQTEHLFGKTILIEDGLSYGTYTQLMGCEPIILQANGETTFNVFDTLGLPLSSEAIALASALAVRLVGVSKEEDTNTLRTAVFGEYIHQLYVDAYDDWRRNHDELTPTLSRAAYAIARYRQERLPNDATFVDAFVDHRDWERTHPDEAEAYQQSFAEEQILAWSKSTEGAGKVRDLAFAFFRPEEFPTLQRLFDLLRYGRMTHHREDLVNPLADILSTWCAVGGQRGRLFDGVNTIDFDTPQVLHFELGKLGESTGDIKLAAGFLINAVIRQKIMTLPRALRKRIVFEEVARFMDMPGGPEIVASGYSTYRKYSTWLISVVQAYAQFHRNADLKKVIRANSKLFFVMRQADPHDLRDIAQTLGLPDVAEAVIRQYPSPEHLPAHDRYSSAMYFCDDPVHPTCGTFRHYATPEMLLASSSDGAVFDQRARELKRYPTAFEGILALAAHETT